MRRLLEPHRHRIRDSEDRPLRNALPVGIAALGEIRPVGRHRIRNRVVTRHGLRRVQMLEHVGHILPVRRWKDELTSLALRLTDSTLSGETENPANLNAQPLLAEMAISAGGRLLKVPFPLSRRNKINLRYSTRGLRQNEPENGSGVGRSQELSKISDCSQTTLSMPRCGSTAVVC